MNSAEPSRWHLPVQSIMGAESAPAARSLGDIPAGAEQVWSKSSCYDHKLMLLAIACR